MTGGGSRLPRARPEVATEGKHVACEFRVLPAICRPVENPSNEIRDAATMKAYGGSPRQVSVPIK
jgi:hypothetical protein